MKLAVILPVYNTAQYLPECLDSLLNQTFQDFCILAVNDASTDNSGDILEQFAQRDSRVRAYHFDENRGANGTARFAMDLAQTMRVDYVARMDSDDVAYPNRFEKQVQFLDEHPDITVLGSNIQLFNEMGRFQKSDLPLHDDLIKVSLCMAAGNIANPASMWRHEWFKQHNIHIGNFRVAEDYAMWVQCALKGAKFANLPDILLAYRLHSQQASKQIALTNQAVQQILPDYLATLFPQLNQDEVKALSRVCHGIGQLVGIEVKQIHLAYQVMNRLIKDLRQNPNQSVLGEKRLALANLLQARKQFWLMHVPEPVPKPIPKKAFTLSAQITTSK